jgi:hypothetical protein
VQFESQPLGTVYGAPAGHSPGDIIFVEDGVTVGVQFFNFPASGGTFNLARIDPAFGGFGAGHVARTNNINLVFGAAGLGTVRRVTIEFADLGGFENVQVNGELLFIGDIGATPAAIANNVTASVATVAIPGGKRGVLMLDGPVEKLLIGGQEFWLDNFCVELVPCPGDLDGDGDRDLTDLSLLLANFGTLAGAGPEDGDLDGDGDVDLTDMALLIAVFGAPC